MNPKEPFSDSSESSQSSGVVDAPGGQALEAVTAERDRLIEEKNDLTDRLLRRQAEFDNFRRRAERDRADVLEFASERQAEDALARAEGPRCRSDGAAHAARLPSGAGNLYWVNPDNAQQWDVLFARGRRLYRVVPPCLAGPVPRPWLRDQ